jgi:hypothetical protein
MHYGNKMLKQSETLHEIVAAAACAGIVIALTAMFFFTASGTQWLH